MTEEEPTRTPIPKQIKPHLSPPPRWLCPLEPNGDGQQTIAGGTASQASNASITDKSNDCELSPSGAASLLSLLRTLGTADRTNSSFGIKPRGSKNAFCGRSDPPTRSWFVALSVVVDVVAAFSTA